MLGIDPSQRHTGLCLLTEAEPVFYEIKTEGMDILTSAAHVRQELRAFLKRNNCSGPFVVEKQLSVGGQSSSLLFHFQMNILEVIKVANPSPVLIMPMPIQLQSYVKKRHGCESPKGRVLVEFFKKQTGLQRRISEHCVDAYYLARLGIDVLAGSWKYPLPSKEAAVVPWRIVNGH